MERQRLRSRLSGSFPISVAVHLVALLLLVMVPLAANIVVPAVIVTLPDYVRVAPMPPLPPVAIRQPQGAPAVAPAENRAAPTEAPSSIAPEMTGPTMPPGPVIDATGGLPLGAGALPSGLIVSMPSPPEPPKPTGPVRVAMLPIAPRKTLDVRPIYPDIARIARVEGTVVMEAVLDTSGRVTQLRVIESVPLLDQAAIDAVRQWRYAPSVYGGHPVSVLMTITIRFRLQ